MDKIIGIYKITNPKGKIYIGQSKDMHHRKTMYKNNQCKGQIKLYNSLIKYGWENHEFEILEECNLEQLDSKEKEYKTEFVRNNGWEEALFLMLEDGKGGNKNDSTKIKMALSSSKIKKKVKVYDLEGKFIAEFDSPTHAHHVLFPQKTGGTGGILDSCNANPPKSHKGFIFQYSDNDNIKTLLPIIQNNKKIKQLKVLQYTLDNIFIKEFPNSYSAEKEFKLDNIRINSTDIRACCTGKQKTAGGYKWGYGESSLELSKSDQIINIQNKKDDFGILIDQFEKEKTHKNFSLSILKK